MSEQAAEESQAQKASAFRRELTKIMPGYQWTVHKPLSKLSARVIATGVQSSGFNRLSTLQVEKQECDGKVSYEVKSAGFGKRAPWLYTASDTTLARALRQLQNHYENMASTYRSHAGALQSGRAAPETTSA